MSGVPNGEDFTCAICAESIPYERGDTVVWPDVRFQQHETKGRDGAVTRGPFLTAHPACFELVRDGLNAPCPTCNDALAPIPAVVPKSGRWACSGCKREYVRGPTGSLRGDDA
jgi:hypothetical protein